MATLTNALQRFDLLQSDDEVKTDLELTCSQCGEVVCDVEPNDNLKVLVEMADAHECDPHDDDGNRLTPAWQGN